MCHSMIGMPSPSATWRARTVLPVPGSPFSSSGRPSAIEQLTASTSGPAAMYPGVPRKRRKLPFVVIGGGVAARRGSCKRRRIRCDHCDPAVARAKGRPMTTSGDRLELLYDVARRVSTFSNLDGLLRYATQRTRELLEAECCSVLLLDDTGKRLYFPVASQAASGRPAPAEPEDLIFPSDRGT